MQTTSDLLIEVVERSASLAERRAEPFQAPDTLSAATSQEAAARFLRWKQQVPRGNEAFFQHRLEWDGLDESSALGLMLRPAYTAVELPAWATLLDSVWKANRELGTIVQSTSWSVPEHPIAFEEVLTPFLAVASHRLEQEAGALLAACTSSARSDLERFLAKLLAFCAERALIGDFGAWRTMPELAPAREIARPIYSSYILWMRTGGLEHLCRDYPVLARMLAEIVLQWIQNTVAFLRQFQEDLPSISAALFKGCDPGVIVRLRCGISDRHNGGKSVIEVQFADGLACFYKPRDCRPEQAFNTLVRWLGDLDEAHRLDTYSVVHRGDHGWVEKAHVRPCEGAPSAKRFFRRCGMLTALLYSLEASDCNFENILVVGDHPVLIDAETLLQPRPHIDEGDSWKALAAATEEMFYDSVLRLHILPRWTARPDGEKTDISGFGAGMGNRGTVRKRVWKDINSDAMQLLWENGPLTGETSLNVSIDGKRVDVAGFLPEILTGFESMYRLLVAQRDDLWAPDGPMRLFLDLPARIVVRNTHTYVGILDRLLAPAALRDGADASIALDLLARLFANSEEKPFQWDLVAAEAKALASANIPCFHAQSSNSELFLGDGGSIPGYFREPAAALLPRRFFQMSEAGLDLQKRYIRSSFGHFGDPRLTSTPLRAAIESHSGEAATFQAEALRLAKAICTQAIHGRDGSISWITQTYNADSQFWQVQPIGLFLYDGIAGIGLFLAALRATLGTDQLEEETRSVLAMLSDLDSPHMHYHLQREAVGAGLGTASLAYCLARIAILRDDETLLDAAFDMARRITPAMIAADRRLDLIGGTAGSLLVLHALNAIRPQSWLRELAIVCGERLLQAQGITPDGLTSWKTIRGNFLAGFSHGAAGIGCALARLYEWIGDPRFRVAAQQAVDYEDFLFDPEKENWPNRLLPNKDGGYEFWNSWCHGAPGIGLGRLASRGAVHGADAYRDLDRALGKAGQMELTSIDGLCCGNFGRIDLLIEAATTLDRPEHLVRAREIGTAALKRAQQEGEYAVGVRNGIFVPSFHQGMAGIGYQMLRLAQPTRLPSVLGWH